MYKLIEPDHCLVEKYVDPDGSVKALVRGIYVTSYLLISQDFSTDHSVFISGNRIGEWAYLEPGMTLTLLDPQPDRTPFAYWFQSFSPKFCYSIFQWRIF